VNSVPNLIRPGEFGKIVMADTRRVEFDFKNEELLSLGKKPDYLFIGDSITHFWELNAYFGGSGRFLVNRGIGGDTSEYVRRRFEADVLQLKPVTVILMIGTNDIAAIDGDPWWRVEGAPEGEVEIACISNIEGIIAMCAAVGQKLVICSVPPSDIAPPHKNPERKALTGRLNTRLQELCSTHGLVYVDYHSSMTGPDGETLIPDFSPDGIHPNAKGYAIMARVLKQALGGEL